MLIWMSEVVFSQGLVKSCLLSGRVGIVSTVCVPILMGLACFFGDRVNSVVEDLSLLTVTHQSSVHAVSWSMAC